MSQTIRDYANVGSMQWWKTRKRNYKSQTIRYIANVGRIDPRLFQVIEAVADDSRLRECWWKIDENHRTP